jgi:Tol biopolymer transport system component
MCCSRTVHLLSGAAVFAVGVWATSFDRIGSAAALAQSSGGTPLSMQGKIAFTSNRDGNDEIYVMNADGTGATRLTDNPASDYQPAWSPDGSRIVFTSNRDGRSDIYVMNTDGSGVTRLTTTTTPHGSTRPVWCGSRIAFESDRYIEFFPDIFVMNEDGTGITRLTIDNASFDRQPSWSPGCDRLAFTKDPYGNVDIYVMNADGTDVRGLTSSAGNDEDPAWSPDGAIAFASTRDEGTPFYEIYLMNADGSGVTRLTDSPASNSKPVWSPDGRIAFVSNRDGDREIYVMNVDGTGVTQLTDNSFSDRDVAWSGTLPGEIGVWPNEPAGFVEFNDQPWDDLTGSWNWLRRGSSKDPDIVADTAARFSPQNVLRMIFTPDMENGSEPSVHWIGLPGVDEIYTAWWIKLSPNWTAGAGTASQITYLFAGDGMGHVSTGFAHPCVWPQECNPEVQGPPYKITAITNWEPYGQQIWYPNMATTRINPGEWHRVEFYYRWETTPGVSGDGVIRWWVDGLLNGNHATVHYPSQRGFLEFQYAPTLETAPHAEQHMSIDHTRVSVR